MVKTHHCCANICRSDKNVRGVKQWGAVNLGSVQENNLLHSSYCSFSCCAKFVGFLPILLDLCNNPIMLLQYRMYPPVECWLIGNLFATACSAIWTGKASFKSFSGNQSDNPSFHETSRDQPWVVGSGTLFPLLLVINPSNLYRQVIGPVVGNLAQQRY
jgi:hypothetical protein